MDKHIGRRVPEPLPFLHKYRIDSTHGLEVDLSDWKHGAAPRETDFPIGRSLLKAIMNTLTLTALTATVWSLILAPTALSQNNPGRPPGPPTDFGGPPPDFGGPPPGGPGGPGGFGGGPRGGPGGPGGPGSTPKTLLVKRFDKNGDQRLDAEERKAAREFLKEEKATGKIRGRGPGGRGRPGGGDETAAPTPGNKLTPAEVSHHPDAPLYDEGVLRTLFFQFESPDWEKELADFNNTDVEVPATLTVDGKTYREVGVHFRGASSYFMVGEGRKRSLNVSLDFAHKDQAIGGNKTLNLLNSHEDPSFLRTVLYSHIAREYLPAPKANLVRVVINGENWGVYANAQQFDKHFTQESFGSTQGHRWKVSGNPNGRGTLGYLGDDPAPYKKIYDLKGKDSEKAWKDLIRLTRVLNQTPPAQLEAALAPILDIDGALRFLALENALINNDGYWIRTSDYALYQDPQGRFHLVPHDMNEAFSRAGGPGFGGGPGGRRGGGGPGGPGGPGGAGGGNRVDGVKLDPLYAAQDENKPLLSKLLAVPALRERYLGHVRTIAEKSLDWQKLGPLAERLHRLIADDVRADGRKLDSTEAFEKSLTQDVAGNGFGPGGGGSMGLKNFADQRRAFLLEYRPKAESPAP